MAAHEQRSGIRSSWPSLHLNLKDSDPSPYGHWLTEITNGPLKTRCWVLQARHFSTRIVYYTKWGSYGNTRKGEKQSPEFSQPKKRQLLYSSESSTPYWPRIQTHLPCVRFLDHFHSFDLGLTRWQASRIPLSPHNCSGMLVSEYSGRNLTFKMQVIAGLAAAFGSLISDEYVAGFWRAQIHRGLLWIPNSEVPPQISFPRFFSQPWLSWARLVEYRHQPCTVASFVSHLNLIPEACSLGTWSLEVLALRG